MDSELGTTCPACGESLPKDAPRGLCPKCLISANVGSFADDQTALAAETANAVSQPQITTPKPQIPRLRHFGDYELLEEIACGGMGVVFKARQIRLKRLVAVKMIRSGLLASQADIRRFHTEAEAAASLQHPNIVAIHEVGEHDGQHYFSMDYLEAKSLAQLIRKQPWPVARAAACVKTVAEAIHYAHQQGILHLDLKPSNVLVDVAGTPHVTDFGLAKRLGADPEMTAAGAILGTPSYMSPEQAAGRRVAVTAASDVYSLGALLYELLTGRPPFHGETTLDTVKLVLEKEPVPPRVLIPKVPRDLETICLKCLEKDGHRRYASAQALADDLDRWLERKPILARPTSSWERTQKWVRRRPAIFFAMAAAIVVSLTGGLTGITWQWRKTVAAREEQTEARERADRALTLMEIQRAEDFFTAGDNSRALAYLARVLRQNPSNEVAAARVLSALSQPSAEIRSPEPFRHEATGVARFSPDGQQLVTASWDMTARVWDAKTGHPLTEPLKHDGGLNGAQFSPDGKWVVTASANHSAQIWDAKTGQPLTEPLEHDRGVNSAEFSPNGQQVVTASWDMTARIWDANSGRPMMKPLKHDSALRSARFSGDGGRVVTLTTDSTARIWDAVTGLPLTEPIKHGLVRSAQFSPDGRWIVTASSDATARVWDANSGQPLFQPLKHSNEVLYAEFDPDGQRVVTASGDATARIWDVKTSRPLTEPLQHGSSVTSAQFSPDGRWVMTVSGDHTVRIWDANTGELLADPLKHEAAVLSAQFSPDGRQVLTASGIAARLWDLRIGEPKTAPFQKPIAARPAQFTAGDKTARLWDVKTNAPLVETMRHTADVRSAQLSPDGQKVATASVDGTARVWDAKSGRPLTPPLPHKAIVRCAQFSPDGQRVATASDDFAIRIWDANTGEPLIEPFKHADLVMFIQFSPDGQRLVTASSDKTARVWDAHTGRPLTEPLRHGAWVRCAQFSPDGKRVVTASEDKTALIWDANTGQQLTAPLQHEAAVFSAEFSPDGKRVVTATWGTTAHIWDAKTGRQLTEPIKHEAWVFSAQFSPDGQRIATASWDKTARVWDAKTGRPLTEPLKHDHVVRSAEFSLDGKRIVTASWDKTARVWDANTGQPLTEPLRHEGEVNSAHFSPDGQRVVTASEDMAARVWEVPTVPVPVPDWLPKLTEAIAGKRFNDQGVSEAVPAAEFLALKQQLAENSVAGVWTRWAKWFFADPATRTISPFSDVTIPDYVQHRIRENTLQSLREAVNLAPTNALAFARLAQKVLAQSPTENPRRVGEAEFFSRRALELAPNDGEVLKIRAEIERQLNSLQKR
ncbi:MAG: protein kinase [Verrucomicrobia bacterium]|nr:protein kinase [Verrucomicrobiota bacterium]